MATFDQDPEPFKFNTPPAGGALKSSEVRRNFDALGRTNFTTDESLPAIKFDGMLRVNASNPNNVRLQMWLAGQWRTLFGNIAGTSFIAQLQIFDFALPSAVWTVNHLAGHEVMVQVLNADPMPRKIDPTSIVQASLDQVIVTHGSPITGKVLIVG